MDTAVATLIADLKQKQLLDKTLIVITTEFGRPPEFDSGGGRGHQGSAFSCVLAGGGLAHRGAWGETDELGQEDRCRSGQRSRLLRDNLRRRRRRLPQESLRRRPPGARSPIEGNRSKDC